MKRLISIALSLIFTAPLITNAGTLNAYSERIQVASWHADVAALSTISKELQTAAENGDPETNYAAAYADYRLANAGQKDLKQYRELIDTVLDRAEEKLEALGNHDNAYQAESLALLSSVYGVKIGLSPIKGTILGIKSGNAIAKAEQLAPNNPRVQLFKGVGKLYTPPLFGGDRVAAMVALNLAINQLQNEPKSAINWGLEDAYIWRGIAEKSAGKKDAARLSFEQALMVAPEQAWAKYLIAELQKKSE